MSNWSMETPTIYNKNITSKYRVDSWSASLSQLQSHKPEIDYVNSREQDMDSFF